MARVWKFGENVDTDQIVPGRYAPYMTSEAELGKYPFVEARPDFAPNVQPGDIIVAGPNFGCGSSREYAPKALKVVGVGAIIAPSFARIFFRNALSLGLPLFQLDLTDELADGDLVELNLIDYAIVADGQRIALPEPPAFVREIWQEGNLIQYYRKHGHFPGQAQGA